MYVLKKLRLISEDFYKSGNLGGMLRGNLNLN